MFRSLIHFEYIFVYGVRRCSSFILLQVVDQFSQHHLLKRLSLIHCIFLPPLSKIRCPYVCGFGFLFCSIDLYFCLCGKWRLLTDLQKVNTSTKPMGTLQPEIPSPTTIPQNWHIIIIDLQDCFFTIPLHPLEWERFSFSLPYPNQSGLINGINRLCCLKKWWILPPYVNII